MDPGRAGDRTRDRVIGVRSRLAVAVAVGLVVWGCAAPAPPPSAAPTPAQTSAPSLAPADAAAVRVTVTVQDRSLVATSAVADFGVEEGIRMVHVRIVDDLELEVRLETDTTVTLTGPPEVCLVGPYSAPDDAGLSYPCWGSPDLGRMLAAQLTNDPEGHPMLQAGQPVVVDTTLARDGRRCDYPPGAWTLLVALGPVGVVTETDPHPIDLPPASFDIAPTTDQPLTLLPPKDVRYCGLAETVVVEQGEPPIKPSN